MAELRRSTRIAMSVLAQRFPDIKHIKLTAKDGDVWQPKHLQLESLGVLRSLASADELQNVDPDMQRLEQLICSLRPNLDAAITVDSNSLESIDYTITEDLFDNSELSDHPSEGEWSSNAESDLSYRAPDKDLNKKRRRKSSDTNAHQQHGKKAARTSKSHASALPPQLPQVMYQALIEARAQFNPFTRSFVPALPEKLDGEARASERKRQYRSWSLYAKHSRNTDVHAAKDCFNVENDTRLSRPAWMGLNASADLRDQISQAIGKPGSKEARNMLRGITRIPYIPHRSVAVCDAAARMFFYRSRLTSEMLDDILPQVNKEVVKFVKAIKKPFAEGDWLANSRGPHWFSIAGHDRNNKEVPKASRFQKDNEKAITEFFNTGCILRRLTDYGCNILRAQFPAIAQRYQESIDYMKDAYKIQAKFGLFFNFCLNAPRKGVKRVFCKPHVDWKNVAFGVCMIFVYGHFDHKEKCWLVIWEAGIAVELPPGVFILYPSSLFLHFNIDLTHLPIVTTPNGERPTKENSQPLYFCGCKSHEGNGAWKKSSGRGSMVWFNQATMVQTSELGVSTLKLAKELGMNTSCDAAAFMEKDIFPMHSG